MPSSPHPPADTTSREASVVPAIAYITLPQRRGWPSFVIGALAVVGVGIAVVGTIASNLGMIVVGLFLAIPCGPLALFFLTRQRKHDDARLRRASLYTSTLAASAPAAPRLANGSAYVVDDHLSVALHDVLLPMFRRGAMINVCDGTLVSRLHAAAAPYGLSLPRTLADQRVAERLRRIELPVDLLEPEHFVGTPSAVSVSNPAVIGVLGLGGAIALFSSVSWWAATFWLFIIGLNLRNTPHLRRLTRFVRWNHDACIGGCGAVLAPGGSKWTINDAIMIVEKRSLGVVQVILTSEIGSLQLDFASVSDPDFVLLWQRWNHLNPQPDLLTA